jgi:hypothetical protein
MVDNQEVSPGGGEESPLTSTIERLNLLKAANITETNTTGVVRRADGTLLPGSVLNPNGARDTLIFKPGILKWLKKDYQGMPRWEHICDRVTTMALQGDLQAAALVHDWLEGKPVARQEVTGANGGAIEVDHRAALLGKFEQIISNSQ